MNRQFESTKSESGIRVKEDDTPSTKNFDVMETACNAALMLGGNPEQWRDALWADVRYMMDYREWGIQNTDCGDR